MRSHSGWVPHTVSALILGATLLSATGCDEECGSAGRFGGDGADVIVLCGERFTPTPTPTSTPTPMPAN